MADGASACAMAGNYTVDDEKLIRFKARTILDCYIESLLPPRIQVNTVLLSIVSPSPSAPCSIS